MRREMNMKKKLFQTILTAVLLLGLPTILSAASTYYYQDFSGTPTSDGWSGNFHMSRDMIVNEMFGDGGLSGTQTDPDHPGTVDYSTGALEIYGRPNNASLFWNNWYVGDGAKWTPGDSSLASTMSASAEEPFGFTVIRYTTSIDPAGNSRESGTADISKKGIIGVWIAEDNGASAMMDRWDNFVYFYEKNEQGTASKFGFFQNYEHDVDLSTYIVDEDGVYPGDLAGTFCFNHDDRDNGWFNTLPTHFAAGDGYDSPTTDEIGIKMTHDGSTIRMYFNPDPMEDSGGLQNTWILIEETAVGWSDDLIAYFSAETPYFRAGEVESAFDEFMIRTVADEVLAEITPKKAVVDDTVTFNLILTATNTGANDSGVGEVFIEKPENFRNWGTLGNVLVSQISADGATTNTLTTRTSGTPGDDEVLVSENSDGMLALRFYMSSASANDIVSDGFIVIDFDVETPLSVDANREGDLFSVYVDCSKHSDTGVDWFVNNTTGIPYATTGRQKAVPADGDDSMTVKTFTQPRATAQIEYSPNPLIVDTAESSFTVKLTTGTGDAPDISKIRIWIPDGFSVSNNTAMDIQNKSVLLGNEVSRTNITNVVENGSNFIYVYYTKTNSGGFSGVNGYDRIDFNVYGTAPVTGTSNTNIVWQVEVNSEELVQNTTWQAATYSGDNMNVRVTMSNAILLSYIYPEVTAVFPTASSNTNYYEYRVRNASGSANNDVYRFYFEIPDDYYESSIAVYSNNVAGATLSLTNNRIYVDYSTPLSDGEVDIVYFSACHTNTDVFMSAYTTPLYCFADNNNSSGYMLTEEDVPSTWSVTMTPPNVYAANFLEPEFIYTTEVSFALTNTIFNTSPRGVGAKLAMIEIPESYFTNLTLADIDSSHIADEGANIELSNNNGTNYVLLKYDGDGDLLDSIYDNPTTPDADVVVITLKDTLSYDTFVSYPTNIVLPTYIYKTETNSSSEGNYALAEAYTTTNQLTNSLYVKLPVADLAYGVSPEVIQTTSITNTLTYQVSNQGLPGNRILSLQIPLPTNVSTSVLNISSSAGGSGSFNALPTVNAVEVSYGTPLDGGAVDTITFDLIDNVDAQDLPNIYLNPSAENDLGWVSGVTNVMDGMSGKIDFTLPKPTGAGWASPNVYLVNENTTSVITQQFTLLVTNMGTGTDVFNRVSVIFPDDFSGNVGLVWSSRLAANQSSPLIDLGSTNVVIDYETAGDTVKAGESDEILVTTYLSNVTGLPVTDEWQFFADNGAIDTGFVPAKEFFEITNAASGVTNLALGTERVSVELVGDALTSDTNVDFSYTIQNGPAGSLPISWAMIQIPAEYTVPSSLNVTVTEASASVAVSNGYVWIDYPDIAGGSLEADERSVLLFEDIVKTLQTVPTNFAWECFVHYEDELNESVTNQTFGTNGQTILVSDPPYYAFVDATEMGKDDTYRDYALTITNQAPTGNNIYFLKIVPPTTNSDSTLIITNIDTLSSSLGGVCTYSNDGNVYVDYSAAATNIAGGGSDTISMIVYDNQDDAGFSSAWVVYAANLEGQEATIPSEDPVDIGESLDFDIVTPGYSSAYYVLPESISTVDDSTNLTVYLNNVGTGGNNIESIRIYLNEPFTTNGLLLSTTAPGTGTSFGSNEGGIYVQVDYPADTFLSLSNDTISMTVSDNFTYGNTNSEVKVTVNYNTSGILYKDSTVSGGTNVVDLVMPDPNMTADLEESDIYTTQDAAEVTLAFINRGRGSNALQRIRLLVPDEFTNGMDVSFISDSNATNKSYSDGEFTLLYSGLAPDTTNIITLYFTNSVTAIGHFNLEAYGYNGVTESASSAISNGLEISVVKPPSAEMTTKTVSAPLFSNTMTLNVNNNTSGDSAVEFVRIDVPPIYTNVVSVSSTLGTIATNLNDTIYVYYASGLQKGELDEIDLVLEDSKDMFETNDIDWPVWVNNSTGYGGARELFTGDLLQDMVTPLPEVTNVLLTYWFNSSGSEGAEPTNLMSMVISNTSLGNNEIYSNILTLPAELTNMGSLSVSAGSPTYSAGTLTIDYSGDPLGYGETCAVSFIFTNEAPVGYADMTNVYYNNSSYGSLTEVSTVSFVADSENTVAYISAAGDMTLYSIDFGGNIAYRIQNGRNDVGIADVDIALAYTNLGVTNIYSELLGRDLLPSEYSLSGGDTLSIDYTALGGFPANAGGDDGSELLTISVVFTNTVNWTNEMTASVRYEGSIERETVNPKTGETQTLPVLIADFGRVLGYALPGFAEPTVKFYYPGTTTIVSNMDKDVEQVTANGDSTGYYFVDYIPGGTYDISFSGMDYDEIIVSNIVIVDNITTNLGTNKMVRSPFDPSGSNQISLCLDDMTSMVSIPDGDVLPEGFSVNIWLTNMTAEQEALALVGGILDATSDGSDIGAFWLEMLDNRGNNLEERSLDGEVMVYFAYDEAELAAKGWEETSLAAYYWRPMSEEWVRLGGEQNTDSNWISIKTSYLHEYYALFGESGTTNVAEGFIAVTAEPKIFTPASTSSAYSTLKISASFAAEEDSYEVKIYNLSGDLVCEYERDDGPYTQAEVFWDATDEDGYDVAPGVYIYQIRIGRRIFSGSIVVVR